MPDKNGRKTRWDGTTDPGERSAIMREVAKARSREVRALKIAKLVESAPPFTPEQRSKLIALLNSHPTAEVA